MLWRFIGFWFANFFARLLLALGHEVSPERLQTVLTTLLRDYLVPSKHLISQNPAPYRQRHASADKGCDDRLAEQPTLDVD